MQARETRDHLKDESTQARQARDLADSLRYYWACVVTKEVRFKTMELFLFIH